MGKGDVRSKKGKIRNGSFGNKRKARITKSTVAAATETVKKETTKAKKSAKKTTKDSE